MELLLTVEDIAQHYSAMMDSVRLLENGKPEGMHDTEWLGTVGRNVSHLELMLAKDYWTDEDMTRVEAVCVVEEEVVV